MLKKGDEAQQIKLETERDEILVYFKADMGKGGRSRVHGGTDEKIRKNIYKAIKTAISHILKSHPKLGDHLKKIYRNRKFLLIQARNRHKVASLIQ